MPALFLLILGLDFCDEMIFCKYYVIDLYSGIRVVRHY